MRIESVLCATRHFEFDPASTSLEKAEFHCCREWGVDPDLPEGHVAGGVSRPGLRHREISRLPTIRPELMTSNRLSFCFTLLNQRTRSQVSVRICLSFGVLVRTTIVNLSPDIWNLRTRFLPTSAAASAPSRWCVTV
jgi:hypothetical protein